MAAGVIGFNNYSIVKDSFKNLLRDDVSFDKLSPAIVLKTLGKSWKVLSLTFLLPSAACYISSGVLGLVIFVAFSALGIAFSFKEKILPINERLHRYLNGTYTYLLLQNNDQFRMEAIVEADRMIENHLKHFPLSDSVKSWALIILKEFMAGPVRGTDGQFTVDFRPRYRSRFLDTISLDNTYGTLLTSFPNLVKCFCTDPDRSKQRTAIECAIEEGENVG